MLPAILQHEDGDAVGIHVVGHRPSLVMQCASGIAAPRTKDDADPGSLLAVRQVDGRAILLRIA